jgi:phage shock protein PspC (stress-responsive transcriptional regulator)
MAIDRSLIRLLLVLFAIVLAVLWLFAAIAAFTVPAWAPPASVIALGVAVLL